MGECALLSADQQYELAFLCLRGRAESRRIEERDPYFRKISQGWSQALRNAFAHIDEYGDENSKGDTLKAVPSYVSDPPEAVAAQATAGWLSEQDR